MSQGDDRLLKTLGNLAREQARENPPAGVVGEPTAEGEARAAERALAALGLKTATDVSAEHAVRQMRPPVTAQGPSFWERLRQRWAVALAIPTLAMLALFFIRMGSGPEGLPAYGLEVLGGVAETRGPEAAAEAPLRVEPGAAVELRLRPSVSVDGPVDVRLYWVKDGRAVRVSGVAEHAPGGAIRVRAPAEMPFGPGAGELVAIVGRPGTLPPESAQDVSAIASAAKQAQLLRHKVEWASAPR
jgi:hypothetical protein